MTSQREENELDNISTAYVKSRDTRGESLVSFSDQTLMTYTTSHHRRANINTSKLKKCLLQRRRIICVTITIILVIILLIWIINNSQGNRNFCPNKWTQSLDISTECSQSTFGCGKLQSVFAGCSRGTFHSWRIFPHDQPDWKIHSKIFDRSLNESEFILKSPHFTIPPDTCTFNLSLCGIDYSTYILTNDQGRVDVQHIDPSTGCTQSIYTNTNYITTSHHIHFTVIVSTPHINQIRYNLHFQRCTKYRAIADYFSREKPSHTPNLPAVMGHNENRCSFEFGEMSDGPMCDWWTIHSDEQPTQFQVVHSFACIENGLISNPKGEKWFMMLTSSTRSSASVISPSFHAHTSHVMLSYYYQLPCENGVISVYITPSPNAYFSVHDYIRQWAPFYQTFNQTDKWTRVDTKLPIPQSMMNDTFHILIHAELDGSAECNNDCGQPIIALEEITTQLKFDQCKNVTDGHEILGCDFDNHATCNWISSGLGNEFEDFQVESSGHSDDNTTGAQARHLKGRGNILGFDPMGKANFEGVYLRSATVAANNNCSCNMQMSYLMRGEFVPRLTVYMKYGESSLEDSKLWSVIGHQSEEWLEADITINLIDQNPPFYIELRLSQIMDSRGFINVDNLRFYGCDVSLVANATRRENYDDYEYEW